MKNSILWNALSTIAKEEERLRYQCLSAVERSLQMREYLERIYQEVREYVLESGFDQQKDEIRFFKEVKPNIVAKLRYYSEIYRLEVTSPLCDGELLKVHYEDALNELKTFFKKYTVHSEFYVYYQSGKTDLDHEYFVTGNSRKNLVFSSYELELDPKFTTYYDSVLSKIIASKLLYPFLESKISAMVPKGFDIDSMELESWKNKIVWTDSKAALIELIHALVSHGSIGHGSVSVTTLARFCEWFFGIELGDIHHSFHRMKTREGSNTRFLDGLTHSFNMLINKNL